MAKEVKELAEATTDAVGSISGRINTIQARSSSVVDSMEAIRKVIDEIGAAQRVITDAFEEQSVAATNIGARVESVASNSEAISNSIAGVAVAARQTSGSAADTHGAAERLTRTATELRLLVSRFRIAETPAN